jgi:hypothetical protein
MCISGKGDVRFELRQGKMTRILELRRHERDEKSMRKHGRGDMR